MNAADQMIMFLGNSTMSDEPPNPQDTYNAAGGLISTLGNAMEASIDTGSRYNNSEDSADGNTTKVESAVSANRDFYDIGLNSNNLYESFVLNYYL